MKVHDSIYFERTNYFTYITYKMRIESIIALNFKNQYQDHPYPIDVPPVVTTIKIFSLPLSNSILVSLPYHALHDWSNIVNICHYFLVELECYSCSLKN